MPKALEARVRLNSRFKVLQTMILRPQPSALSGILVVRLSDLCPIISPPSLGVASGYIPSWPLTWTLPAGEYVCLNPDLPELQFGLALLLSLFRDRHVFPGGLQTYCLAVLVAPELEPVIPLIPSSFDRHFVSASLSS